MWRLHPALVVLVACARPHPAPPAPAPEPPTPIIASAVAPEAAPRDPCEGDGFGVAPGATARTEAIIASKRGTMGVATRQMVLASHATAAEVGLAVLRSGGNAADAFVAAALVDDVVLPGVTSTAGLAGILVYQASTGHLTYVHGGLADAIDPANRCRPGDTAIGKHVLVPGAPAAYAEVVRRFGTRPLKELVEPAARLATAGFPADRLYAASIAHNRTKLEGSAFGRKAFFHDGRPVAQGETVRLEELGKTLRAFGNDGAVFYRGAWARDAVATVRANGGLLTLRDFAAYAPQVAPAMHGRFAGFDVYAAGWGGAKLLTSLGALELLGDKHATAPHSADALEVLLRVQRSVDGLQALAARELTMQGPAADDLLVRSSAAVTESVQSRPLSPTDADAGTHSSAVVVVDARGDIVVGTHTIEATNWGEGLFVGGVPLSPAGVITRADAATAVERVRADPLSDTIVLERGAPRVALAVYGIGLYPADLQVLDAVLSRGLDAEDAVLEPRVGYYQYDVDRRIADAKISVADPRLPRDVLCAMKRRGLRLEGAMPGYPPGIVDTGFPTLLTLAPGKLHGMTPELMSGVAAGD
jgi:gamma-glutamyltranspeptidase/glutathione hydrolase